MDLTGWVTQERFNEYMVAANRDIKAARELYEWNVAISAAFFEVVSHVEVALRNAIDKILRPLEVTESARTEVRNGWWFASSTFLKDEDLVFIERHGSTLAIGQRQRRVTRFSPQ